MSSAAPQFPAPRTDDDGDVHWALTTAAALWAKGDGVEALKWLRRAAESASDANQDARSLELFKAAADVTSRLQSNAAIEAQPATMGPSSMAPHTELAPPVMAPHPPPRADERTGFAQATHAKSAPPPPPRRGGGQGGARSTVEPMANTVPGSRLPPGPPPMPLQHPHAAPPPMPQVSPSHAPLSDARASKPPITPSSPTRISGRAPIATAGKTLASNLTYEQAKDTAAEIRRAVAKTVQPDGRARPIPTAAKMSSDRTTHHGMGPLAVAQADAPPPSSRGKRRTTQTGRKHAGAVAAARAQIGEINRQSSPEAHRTPTVVFRAVRPPTEVAIHEAVPSEMSRTQRFEDEGTIAEKEEREPTLIGVSFPDLDEQTNVLTGKQTNAVLGAGGDGRLGDESGAIDVSLDGSGDDASDLRSDVDPATDPGEAVDADTRQTAVPRGLLSAFRVAVSDNAGRVELVPLVPGEPTPAGAVGCMLVATDVQSSVALADLLGKRVRRGQKQ